MGKLTRLRGFLRALWLFPPNHPRWQRILIKGAFWLRYSNSIGCICLLLDGLSRLLRRILLATDAWITVFARLLSVIWTIRTTVTFPDFLKPLVWTLTVFRPSIYDGFLLPGFNLGSWILLLAIRIQSDLLVFLLFLKKLHLTTIFLQFLQTTLVKFFTPTEFRDGLVSVLTSLFATLTIAIGNFFAEILTPLNRHGLHALFDPNWLEPIIPARIKIRRTNGQSVALKSRTHR